MRKRSANWLLLREWNIPVEATYRELFERSPFSWAKLSSRSQDSQCFLNETLSNINSSSSCVFGANLTFRHQGVGGNEICSKTTVFEPAGFLWGSRPPQISMG